jgi:DNA-binding NarL/FixJ family response regulator
MIKIFLVDNQESILKGLQMQIALESDLLVVGETSNSQTALQLIEETKPDVVVMDLDMPSMDGIQTIQALRSRGIMTPVIILSIGSDPTGREKATTGGAAKYVVKQASPDELFAAIRQAATGYAK